MTAAVVMATGSAQQLGGLLQGREAMRMYKRRFVNREGEEADGDENGGNGEGRREAAHSILWDCCR